ncbi:MAG TPA: CDP-alcohol phosphatidyltransferase family protein [Phycisphaerae bacterium]|nr:CDP-alcohol phosphatidyltransferase family protein [Phycisphaerae bacterium]
MRYRRRQMEMLGEGGVPVVRKRRRGVALLPAMFTLGNCLCGFASINYASRHLGGGALEGAAGAATGPGSESPYFTFAVAGYCIFAAMIFDMFDGFVARLTRSASDFGAELDSLADMVSFGLAPAFLAIRLITELLRAPAVAGSRAPFADLPGPFSDDVWGRLFWVIGALYVSCTALRLARFNVLNKHEVSSHMNFRGMPSPGAAAVVASSVIFFATLNAQHHVIPWRLSPHVQGVLQATFPYVLPVVVLVAGLLMVSRFAYAHLINRFLRGRKKFRTVVLALLVVMLIWAQPQVTTLVAIYAYALSAPVTAFYYRSVRRRGGGGGGGGGARAEAAGGGVPPEPPVKRAGET